MPNYDFVVDYKTPAGVSMHQACKVRQAGHVLEAAAGLMSQLQNNGCQVVCISYSPGDHSLQELDAAADYGIGTGNWWPVYIDRSAIADMAAPC